MVVVAAFLVLVLLIVGIMMVTIYNGLVSLKNQIDRAWANVDVILKQRFDEIPQLIQVVEQYASYEQNTLNKIIQARSSYSSAQDIKSKINASNEMSLALKGLVALGESYPDLKANQSFLQLQGRISELENAIADRREHYNDTVTNYNTRIEQIPDVFFASLLGYAEKPLYRPPATETILPSLKLNMG